MSLEIRTVLVAAAVCFLCFRLYRRVRGSIGRQPLQKTWLVVRGLGLLALCGIVLVFSPGAILETTLCAVGGAVLGALVAAYALRHTWIEHTEQGVFYSGPPYIGLGLVGLFVARLLFVFVSAFSRRQVVAAQMKAHGGGIGNILSHYASGPLTAGILVFMSSYYITYSLGLLRRA